MNVDSVIKQLKQKYPGKKIVINTPENPTEIICEIEPGVQHSLAVAVVNKIRPHYHKKLTEVYKVTKGALIHHMGEMVRIIKEGESVIIPPGVVHWAEGKETWFSVSATPGWSPDDHILVLDGKELSRKHFNNK